MKDKMEIKKQHLWFFETCISVILIITSYFILNFCFIPFIVCNVGKISIKISYANLSLTFLSLYSFLSLKV